MDGLLIVDKPVGPTSHDVVVRMRRALGERRIGHTGTLDPHASGVLPLVLGQATRLARFLIAGDKAYDAVIDLGVSTDTYDAQGSPIGPPWTGRWPGPDEIERALGAFRGTFLQQPPLFSAKKVGGRRSYDIARRAPRRAARSAGSVPAVAPAPVEVTLRRLELVEADGPRLSVRLTCSPGFYVRSLAHDLGARLGTGAHLAALRRTASSGWTLADACPLDQVEADRAAARARLVPMAQMLPGSPALELSSTGVHRVARGLDIGRNDLVDEAAWDRWEADRRESSPPGCASGVCLMAGGDLVAVAEPSRPGLLHPSVVLV